MPGNSPPDPSFFKYQEGIPDEPKKATPARHFIHGRVCGSVDGGHGRLELQRPSFSGAASQHLSISVWLSQQARMDAPGVSPDPPI